MSGTAAAAEEYDGVIEDGAGGIVAGLESCEESGELLAEEQVVAGELELSVAVGGVRQAVVCASEAELEREGVADSHAVFAIEHESGGAGDIGIEGECNQVEHIAIVVSGSSFIGDIEIEV